MRRRLSRAPLTLPPQTKHDVACQPELRTYRAVQGLRALHTPHTPCPSVMPSQHAPLQHATRQVPMHMQPESEGGQTEASRRRRAANYDVSAGAAPQGMLAGAGADFESQLQPLVLVEAVSSCCGMKSRSW